MGFLTEKKGKTKRMNGKQMNTFIIVILIVIVTAFLFLWTHVTDAIRPTLVALCKVKSQGLASSIAGKVVQDVMGGLGYLDLITLDRDEEGNIMALRANVIEMNKLSANINNLIQEEYSHLEDLYIKIPLGNFTGNELLARKGTTSYCENYTGRDGKYRL